MAYYAPLLLCPLVGSHGIEATVAGSRCSISARGFPSAIPVYACPFCPYCFRNSRAVPRCCGHGLSQRTRANGGSAPTAAPPTSAPTVASESHPTEVPTPTFDEQKAASTQLSYDDLFRNNEEHIGKTIWYTGEVIQVIEGDEDEYQLRVNVTEGEIFWDDTVFLRYSGSRLLEDDIIEFVGRVNGLIAYEAVMGNEVTIPDITVIAHRRLGGAESPTSTVSISLRPTATPVSPESETVSPSPTLPLISTPSRTNAPGP